MRRRDSGIAPCQGPGGASRGVRISSWPRILVPTVSLVLACRSPQSEFQSTSSQHKLILGQARRPAWFVTATMKAPEVRLMAVPAVQTAAQRSRQSPTACPPGPRSFGERSNGARPFWVDARFLPDLQGGSAGLAAGAGCRVSCSVQHDRQTTVRKPRCPVTVRGRKISTFPLRRPPSEAETLEIGMGQHAYWRVILKRRQPFNYHHPHIGVSQCNGCPIPPSPPSGSEIRHGRFRVRRLAPRSAALNIEWLHRLESVTLSRRRSWRLRLARSLSHP